MLRLKCPHCGHILGIEAPAGSLGLCPICCETFRVPVPAVVLGSPPPAAPAPPSAPPPATPAAPPAAAAPPAVPPPAPANPPAAPPAPAPASAPPAAASAPPSPFGSLELGPPAAAPPPAPPATFGIQAVAPAPSSPAAAAPPASTPPAPAAPPISAPPAAPPAAAAESLPELTDADLVVDHPPAVPEVPPISLLADFHLDAPPPPELKFWGGPHLPAATDQSPPPKARAVEPTTTLPLEEPRKESGVISPEPPLLVPLLVSDTETGEAPYTVLPPEARPVILSAPPRKRRRRDELEVEPGDLSRNVPPPPPRKKGKSRGAVSLIPGVDDFYLVVAVLALLLTTVIVLMLVSPKWGLLSIIVGGLIYACGVVWLWQELIDDGLFWCVAVILVPPFGLIYALTHQDRALRPYLLVVAGLMLALTGWAVLPRDTTPVEDTQPRPAIERPF